VPGWRFGIRVANAPTLYLGVWRQWAARKRDNGSKQMVIDQIRSPTLY
jgi:hypothetical protein